MARTRPNTPAFFNTALVSKGADPGLNQLISDLAHWPPRRRMPSGSWAVHWGTERRKLNAPPTSKRERFMPEALQCTQYLTYLLEVLLNLMTLWASKLPQLSAEVEWTWVDQSFWRQHTSEEWETEPKLLKSLSYQQSLESAPPFPIVSDLLSFARFINPTHAG